MFLQRNKKIMLDNQQIILCLQLWDSRVISLKFEQIENLTKIVDKCAKVADSANSNQTAPSLIWVFTVCSHSSAVGYFNP